MITIIITTMNSVVVIIFNLRDDVASRVLVWVVGIYGPATELLLTTTSSAPVMKKVTSCFCTSNVYESTNQINRRRKSSKIITGTKSISKIGREIWGGYREKERKTREISKFVRIDIKENISYTNIFIVVLIVSFFFFFFVITSCVNEGFV